MSKLFTLALAFATLGHCQIVTLPLPRPPVPASQSQSTTIDMASLNLPSNNPPPPPGPIPISSLNIPSKTPPGSMPMSSLNIPPAPVTVTVTASAQSSPRPPQTTGQPTATNTPHFVVIPPETTRPPMDQGNVTIAIIQFCNGDNTCEEKFTTCRGLMDKYNRHMAKYPGRKVTGSERGVKAVNMTGFAALYPPQPWRNYETQIGWNECIMRDGTEDDPSTRYSDARWMGDASMQDGCCMVWFDGVCEGKMVGSWPGLVDNQKLPISPIKGETAYTFGTWCPAASCLFPDSDGNCS